MKVIKIIGLADGRPNDVDGAYLRLCDVDFGGGRGKVYGTNNIEKAMKFASAGDALTYWKRTSTILPTRVGYDDKPNRPFTAYTIQIMDEP